MFSNSGSVLVAGGTVSFNNGFTGGGYVSIAAGATIGFGQANTFTAGTMTGGGTAVFSGGTFDPGFQFSVPNVVLNAGDTLTLDENASILGSMSSGYRSAVVLNGNTVTLGSSLAANFGNISGLSFDNGGVGGEIVNRTSIALDNDYLDNGVVPLDEGLATLSGDRLDVASATISIAPAGTLSLQAGVELFPIERHADDR